MVRPRTDPNARWSQYRWAILPRESQDDRSQHETMFVSSLRDRPGQTRREAGTQSQGSPIGDRPAADPRVPSTFLLEGREHVKANLARFTWAVMLLATMALATGAGMRWDLW